MQLARGLEVVGVEADLASLKCFDEACRIFGFSDFFLWPGSQKHRRDASDWFCEGGVEGVGRCATRRNNRRTYACVLLTVSSILDGSVNYIRANQPTARKVQYLERVNPKD